MPASLMWAAGLEARPARVQFVPPPGKTWNVATQLFPTSDPLAFTAPNLHYLMDSPTEFGAFTLRTSGSTTASGRRRRSASRCTTTAAEAEADAFARDVERIVRETIPIFGEFPRFENNTYTFLVRLSAVGQRRRHGASQQHRALVALARCATRPAPGHPRHRRARVLPLLEHGAHPRRGRSSRSTSRTPTCRTSCGSARASPAISTT